MLVLRREEIYQGNLILVNRNYPVRHWIKEQDLRPVFENQPEICMQRESAKMLQKLLMNVTQQKVGAGQPLAGEVSEAGQPLAGEMNCGGRKGNVKVLEEEPSIVGVSGYRTREEQIQIFEDSLRENGREFTEKYVAFPDHSEHQTGLAIDLAENREGIDFICPEFPREGICQKFREKMAGFGFIERYAKEKQNVTGIGAEPWHFRYVGAPHARLMQQKDMALEEYVEWLKQFQLLENPLSLYMQKKEIKIGYLRAQGETTRIDGWDAWMDSSQNIKVEVSGNNVDGFILTCTMGEIER